MNDQKQKIKPIYKVMIFTIILTFVLALTMLPAFADEPQVTNLIGTTWRLDGSFQDIEMGTAILDLTGSYETTMIGVAGYQFVGDFSQIALGYNVGEDNFISTPNHVSLSGVMSVIVDGVVVETNDNGYITITNTNSASISTIITITGGADISNPLFIDFINTYGTLVSDGADVITPTIYDIWDDILEWMVNAAENMTAAFYYNEQLTLLGILCVIPLSFGLVILIIKIFEEWIALR